MSQNLNQLFTEQFSTNLKLRLQQTASKLRGRVMEGAHVGKMVSPVNYVGPIAMKPPAGRFAPLNRTDAEFMRRWVFPQEGEIVQYIDSFDRLQTIVDPTSEYSVNSAAACGRGWDDAVINAAFGTAQIGTDNGSLSAEAFSSSYVITDTFGNSSTTIGMTVEKLIEARRMFRHAHVDLEAEELTLVIGSQQEADMLKLVQVVSREFNDTPVLVNGRLQQFLGWNIVVSERLNVVSNVRQCIAFVKSGMYLGLWQDMLNDVDIAKELSGHPYRLYTSTMYGATRLEPGRVLMIKCGNDTTGGDNV